MAGKNPQDGAEKLRQQIARLSAKLRKKEAAAKTQDRKNDTRRKVITGAHALTHMEKNRDSEFTKTLTRILNEYVTRPDERELLGLKPLSETHPKNARANDSESDNASLKTEFQSGQK